MLRHAIRRPVGDPRSLMLDLEVDTVAPAGTFTQFLEQRVWSSPSSAPALAGVPRARLLELVGTELAGRLGPVLPP